jgi:hypothetical protein
VGEERSRGRDGRELNDRRREVVGQGERASRMWKRGRGTVKGGRREKGREVLRRERRRRG